MNLNVKKELCSIINKELDETVVELKERIKVAQEEANEHKGAMQSRYDTFKEEAQYRKSGFERQLNDTLNEKSVMAEIKHKLKIQLGSIIKTNEYQGDDEIIKVYFISSGVASKPIKIDGVEYQCISPSSPIGEALINAEDYNNIIEFKFGDRQREIEILEII